MKPDATPLKRAVPRKLPARCARWLMPLLLSVLMTCVVSMISTLRSAGLHPHPGWLWLSAWALSWLIAFPTLLVMLPLVRRLTRGWSKVRVREQGHRDAQASRCTGRAYGVAPVR